MHSFFMRFLPVIFGILLAIGVTLAPPVLAGPSIVISPSGMNGGVSGGVNALAGVVNSPTGNVTNIRGVIVSIINFVLSFLALIAVIAIIAAGFVLIFGFGSEASATRARKIILYTILGLVVIFFARVIVGFFTEELPKIL